MLKDFFRKPRQYATVPTTKSQKEIPEGIMHKCSGCASIGISKEYKKSMKVCKECGFHGILSSAERVELTLDEGSWNEFNAGMLSSNPLNFPGYEDKLTNDRDKTGIAEAIITGTGEINGCPLVLGVMDARFRMGSMGSVVGEKILLAINKAIEEKLPLVLFSASGGARMQEGMLSLMQMAKTSAGLERLDKERLLYISVLTDPTTGGVAASFSSLGDIILAEPGALIGFAGRRVVEKTMLNQKLPANFQTAEFLLEHGHLDKIVHRHHLRETLGKILEKHRVKIYG